MLLKMKEKRSPEIAAFLARDLENSLQNGCILKSDALITHVPRDPAALLEKGTDQARELAQALARHCSLQHAVCLQNAGGKKQKTLSARERLENARERFSLSAHCPDLAGKQVILVDDILTAGATLTVCAELLKSKGASSVICLAAGRR